MFRSRRAFTDCAYLAVFLISLLATSCATSTSTTTGPISSTPPPGRTIESVAASATTKNDATLLPGAGVAAADEYAQWTGTRVGLIANQSSLVNGRHTADLMAASDTLELVALFSPEHGLRGERAAGEWVPDEVDPVTGLTVHSLYGETRSPTPESLSDLDVLFYDLQDVGTRYYTYISTMGLAMQAAAGAGVAFVVLDRPNPLGQRVEGSVLQPGSESFVGMYPIPDVYGLSAGELAQAIVGEQWIDGVAATDLTVVPYVAEAPLDGWPEPTPWIAPSPAIASLNTARTYPATVFFEATSMSFGRGTDLPFQVVGAPWVDEGALATTLNELELPGVNFEPIRFTPRSTPGIDVAHEAVEVGGVRLRIANVDEFRPVEIGVHMLATIHQTAPEDILDRPKWLTLLTGSPDLSNALTEGQSASTLIESWADPLKEWTDLVEPYRIYPTGEE